jgi:hypothetical protein
MPDQYCKKNWSDLDDRGDYPFFNFNDIKYNDEIVRISDIAEFIRRILFKCGSSGRQQIAIECCIGRTHALRHEGREVALTRLLAELGRTLG